MWQTNAAQALSKETGWDGGRSYYLEFSIGLLCSRPTPPLTCTSRGASDIETIARSQHLSLIYCAVGINSDALDVML